MKVRAWVSDDGQTVTIAEHEGEAGLMAWWRSLPGIVGVVAYFGDGTTHHMEASEFYAVLPRGRGRKRFWNGDCCAPPDAVVKLGIEVPDAIYEAASEEMARA
jgi:hypothetical protein